MPFAPPTICPRCKSPKRGRCEPCHKIRQRANDEKRNPLKNSLYNARWRRARKMYLAMHPLCAQHDKDGEVVAASVVDHIIPHRGDWVLFWDETNWQPLCKPCHDTKTATEDGGFGR